jgi:relaxase/mobilisation nuclease domain
MAITKILHINEVDMGNPARHLEQALDYIQNPEKTNGNVLVGSINCLPETAFEQMMDTKMTFGKMDKRQGYHIIISFVPGETTEEIAFDIVERFAKEYLKDEYEAVYAVHNDKDHMHAHLIFNSVNLVTGMKYEYRKGEWKRRMQPITNKLCKEYNLEIMPAEYAREPKNLSRVEWEQEQQFKEMILADALFCQNYAGSMDHFIFLMKRIGYQFEYGKYLSVKVPGGKWYHQLDKLDERFGKENFKYYLDMGFSRPRFISTNPLYLYRSGLSEFQLKFYHKMYRIRMVEQKRFDKNAAWMAKELQKFHQMQKEYLFLVNNDIKSVEGLITYEVLKGMDVERISNRQKEIYKESGARKRACKTIADVREFQIWHMQAQEELDDLKAEKREIKDNLKLVEGCKKELQQFTMLDLVSIEEKVSNTVQVPEYPYGDERAETVMDVVENDLDAVGDMEVSVEVKANAEEYIDDKNLSEAEFTDVEENMDKSVNYESFMSMSPEDMAGILGFDRIVGIDEVHSKVSSFFRDVKSYVDGNEIMDVAKLVYKGMRANFIKQRAEEIVEAINSMGLSYPCLTDKEKAELFRFLPDDNNYNLELHMAILKACGLKLEFDEVYEDYQRIYDKTMEMQDEKMNERGESVRGRAR